MSEYQSSTSTEGHAIELLLQKLYRLWSSQEGTDVGKYWFRSTEPHSCIQFPKHRLGGKFLDELEWYHTPFGIV